MLHIFFDTNVMGNYKGDTLKELSGTSFGACFENFIKYVQQMGIQDKVKIYVPEIVVNELHVQLHKLFKEKKAEIETVFKGYKDIFGTLLKEYALPSIYKLTIKQLKANIQTIYNDVIFIDTPKDKIFWGKILSKSFTAQPPFFKIEKTNSRKGCSDAGFKDAVIWETIRSLEIPPNDIFIIVTNDGDFNNVAEFQTQSKKYKKFSEYSSLVSFVTEACETRKEYIIKRRFESDFKGDQYLMNIYIREKLAFLRPIESLEVVDDSLEVIVDEDGLEKHKVTIKIKCKKWILISVEFDYPTFDIFEASFIAINGDEAVVDEK